MIFTDLIFFFLARSRDIAMATNFRVKWAKSADSSSFVALALLNGVEYRNFDFKRFIRDDLATSCNNLVNVGLVTPEFRGAKMYTLIDQQFG